MPGLTREMYVRVVNGCDGVTNQGRNRSIEVQAASLFCKLNKDSLSERQQFVPAGDCWLAGLTNRHGQAVSI